MRLEWNLMRVLSRRNQVMNTVLQLSLETAERVLSAAGQERPAFPVDTFTANFESNPHAAFSPEELQEIRQFDKPPVVEADQEKAEALFAKHQLWGSVQAARLRHPSAQAGGSSP